jgi:hypothetical protein
VSILYIFSGFGIMYQEKSGNPGVGTTVSPRFRKFFFATIKLSENQLNEAKINFFATEALFV